MEKEKLNHFFILGIFDTENKKVKFMICKCCNKNSDILMRIDDKMFAFSDEIRESKM